jgi:chorismate-pyruvate lyase
MPAGDARILGPLAGFYVAAGRPLPRLETLAADALPEPLRALLTDALPLTPRLEERHGETLALRVLERRRDGDRYARRIVLVRSDGMPVALGAIEIDLARLAPAWRAEVLAETTPFGHIVAVSAQPEALFRVACDDLVGDALSLRDRGRWLYGRRRTLVDDAQVTLARIVEILAPEPAHLERLRRTGS